jgi:cytochrome c oxidase assembly factor CtaG
MVRAFVFVALDLLAIVLWRTPAAGNALQRHWWLALVEALVLLPLGIGLWLECVPSPPLEPRCPRPQRAALAAIAMWTFWIVAYLVAMSRTGWYTAFHHAGTTLSATADQQLSSVVLWFFAAASFMPVIFVNLIAWLRSEDEDPDTELHRLMREERRRAMPTPPSNPPPRHDGKDTDSGSGH